MSTPPVAFVTGAGTGIGAATARALADAGYALAVCDVADEPLQAVAAELTTSGASALSLPLDVTDAQAVDDAVQTTVSQLGTPTAVFTAAGIMRVAPFLELDVTAWRRTLDVNLTGTFLVQQACARAMVAQGCAGSMVAVASVAARGPRPDAADYAASKAGIVSLVRSAAVALGPHQIRVNAICPGVVDTEMTRRNAERRAIRDGITAEEAIATLIRGVPLGRAGTPGEIAAIAVRLLTEEFGYVTGQALNVCGGLEFD